MVVVAPELEWWTGDSKRPCDLLNPAVFSVMMPAIGPLQGGRTIVGRGEPGAAVLPVLDWNTAYSRTALATVNGELYFKGPVRSTGK